ncbi:MAG: hypothetical protein HY326_09690 [Chloroflexi bacterium]|nr:hypothetical protein [Chloroflexota bacterium]
MITKQGNSGTRYSGRFDEVGGAFPSQVYPLSSGALGGALGGTAMVLVAILYGLVSGKGIWYPVNLIATVGLRELQRMPGETLGQFHPDGLIFGLVVHYGMSLVLGVLFVLLLPTLPGFPVLWAVILGPAMWMVATFLVLPLVNPLMATLVDWPSFLIANVVFSLFMGWWIWRTPKIDAV